jgi:integrase
VYGLLPHDVAEELRSVPASAYTHPKHFFWSGRSKRKSEVSNWIKIFGKILATATEKHPKLFEESDGQPKSAHLHMLRDTFAVEYLLAGMPLEEVSRLLGHSSVLITQKHYAPWVLERQQRLATSVRTAWSTMGLGGGAPVVNIADGRLSKAVRRAAGQPRLAAAPDVVFTTSN